VEARAGMLEEDDALLVARSGELRSSDELVALLLL
jgi:hypothetical protein